MVVSTVTLTYRHVKLEGQPAGKVHRVDLMAFILSTTKNKRVGSHFYIAICTAFLVYIFWHHSALGVIRGVCSDCHTMHNSQDNSAMNYDGSDTPNNSLTRETCLGCHAQGGPSPTITMGSSIVPQVMHSSSTHLAGGNFGYITGMAGNGAAHNKGHNLAELTGTDSVLWGPPGSIKEGPGHAIGTMVNTDGLRCADNNGCHGYRAYGPGGISAYQVRGITGAHHKNEDGRLDQATEPGNSYRFLMAVKGFESSDWQENPSIGNHNEYFALSSPVQLGCSSGLIRCHIGPGGLVRAPYGSMSLFCATCHGNFHTLAGGLSDGIGTTASSPFIRHPTDLSLPARGEYLDYTTYNLDSPVARLNVPAASSSAVTPGSDAVMCLSCHLSHASDYPSMLRWDYSTMIAGNAGAAADTGCFVCHSTKD